MGQDIRLEDAVEFEDNPEPRCAVVLLLDTSGSMKGQPIAELNAALKEFDRALKNDTLASLRVEVAIVTFGGKVQAVDVREGGRRTIPFDANQAFITVDQLQPPTLSANGPGRSAPPGPIGARPRPPRRRCRPGTGCSERSGPGTDVWPWSSSDDRQ